jgi:hypothetical protein
VGVNAYAVKDKRMGFKLGIVAHAYNPSYSGGRDEEDGG